MGKRENGGGDGQSMTPVSSSRRSAAAAVDPTQLMPPPTSSALPATATPASSSSAGGAAPVPAGPRKTGRLFSLRCMIQDVQQQRLGSSRRQRRSVPLDAALPPTDTASAAAPTPAECGWYTPRAVSMETLDTEAVCAAVDGAGDDVSEPGGGNDTVHDCSLCAVPQPRSCFARVTATCSHRACVDCLRRYLTIEIMESRVNVECPACPERLHPNDVRRLLGSDCADLVAKYEEFALRRLLVHDPDARWCPAPDCGYVTYCLLCRIFKPLFLHSYVTYWRRESLTSAD